MSGLAIFNRAIEEAIAAEVSRRLGLEREAFFKPLLEQKTTLEQEIARLKCDLESVKSQLGTLTKSQDNKGQEAPSSNKNNLLIWECTFWDDDVRTTKYVYAQSKEDVTAAQKIITRSTEASSIDLIHIRPIEIISLSKIN
jgi:hypothetical protein